MLDTLSTLVRPAVQPAVPPIAEPSSGAGAFAAKSQKKQRRRAARAASTIAAAARDMAAFLGGQADSGLRLRAYRWKDAEALARLFHDSVHRAAAADYTLLAADCQTPHLS